MSKSQYSNPVIQWIDYRLPIFTFVRHSVGDQYPTPRNLSYWWNFGSLAGISLIIMLVTGIFLAMHYTADTATSFGSVERIMRDVNAGWLMRYLHANGASFFFIVVYLHMFRGLYYGSYKEPREIVWMLGVVILFLMMGTAFMGYVLPWGQMSFWGATVITNLASAIPLIGDELVTLLWGGFSVNNPTLTRFFALHYLMPFAILGVVVLHMWALHEHKSNNPLGIDGKGPQDYLPFHPYYTIKDLFGLAVFLLVFCAFVFFAPNYLGHPDNYIPADPLVTPSFIVPEWYFLPFYAMLRAITFDILFIDAKLGGVIVMGASIGILFLLPWLDTSKVRSCKFRPIYKWFMFALVGVLILLGFCGAKPAEGIWVPLSQFGTAWYFAHFLIILPLLGWFETPKPLPSSISESVLGKGGGGGRVAGATAAPMDKSS